MKPEMWSLLWIVKENMEPWSLSRCSNGYTKYRRQQIYLYLNVARHRPAIGQSPIKIKLCLGVVRRWKLSYVRWFWQTNKTGYHSFKLTSQVGAIFQTNSVTQALLTTSKIKKAPCKWGKKCSKLDKKTEGESKSQDIRCKYDLFSTFQYNTKTNITFWGGLSHKKSFLGRRSACACMFHSWGQLLEAREEFF